MNIRRTTLNIRKATHIQINQIEFKFNKLNPNAFSKLKSELIKNRYKMPSIKKKSESFKIRRFCSPTTFRDLKCRMTSPVNYRRNFKNLKKTSRCIPKISPVNDQILKDYTHDQMLLIDKISRKVADARSFRNRGFRSPRALSKTLLKETRFSPSCNDCFLRVPNVQSNLDSFITLQNRDAFSIERLRGGNVLLSL